ncbi:hypothetical protein [Roseateles puraquae]|uniref:hypothetical protein n=1 Tax=Roseateles puraquae TaxID=431059 RepID=UPI0031E2A3A3
MGKSVDNSILDEWRNLDALLVLKRLGCYSKQDLSFEPVKATGTQRYHVNANGVDYELLVKGPRFFDTRAQRGGGGAVDLVMHLYGIDFKSAVKRLRAAS